MDLSYFKHIAGDNLFKQWLAKEKAAALKYLAMGEGVALHRAQGRYTALDEIEKAVEAAKDLR